MPGFSPPEDSAKKGGVETLGGREPPLNLADGHFVLGGGAEEGEAPRNRAEDFVGVGHPSDQGVFVHSQGRDGRAVGLRGDGHWKGTRKHGGVKRC